MRFPSSYIRPHNSHTRWTFRILLPKARGAEQVLLNITHLSFGGLPPFLPAGQGGLDGGSVPLDDLLAGVEVAHRAFHHSGCEPGEVLAVVVVGVLSPVRAFGAARVVGAEDLFGEDPVGQGRISVEEQPREEAGVEGGCLVVGGRGAVEVVGGEEPPPSRPSSFRGKLTPFKAL